MSRSAYRDAIFSITASELSTYRNKVFNRKYLRYAKSTYVACSIYIYANPLGNCYIIRYTLYYAILKNKIIYLTRSWFRCLLGFNLRFVTICLGLSGAWTMLFLCWGARCRAGSAMGTIIVIRIGTLALASAISSTSTSAWTEHLREARKHYSILTSNNGTDVIPTWLDGHKQP